MGLTSKLSKTKPSGQGVNSACSFSSLVLASRTAGSHSDGAISNRWRMVGLEGAVSLYKSSALAKYSSRRKGSMSSKSVLAMLKSPTMLLAMSLERKEFFLCCTVSILSMSLVNPERLIKAPTKANPD
jgi:hypothetical protein